MRTKVLVAAKWLALDKTSEGICSSKFVLALARGGFDVTCVTTDDVVLGNGKGTKADWLKPVRLVHAGAVRGSGPWTRLGQLTASASGSGAAAAYAARKLNAAWAYTSGYDFPFWHEVELWMRAIQQAVETERPDAIVIRGAGLQFAAYMAMLRWQSPVPWIANYHDPFPLSLYPVPYRRRTPLMSTRQEALHRKIVASADALTFPSERLLKWVLRGALDVYRNKAFVLPHIASDLRQSDAPQSEPCPDPERFTIVHTGTVLRERDPRPLLRAFSEFLEGDPRRREAARLVFVGGVARPHLASREWTDLAGSKNFEYRDSRITYQAALDSARAADAVLVLEANAAESPFFPAKLADYLWIGKPVFALSPRQSATADIIGPDHPLRVAPDDVPGMKQAMALLWDKWTARRLADLVTEPRVMWPLSEAAVQSGVRNLIDFVSSSRLHRAC